MRDIFIIASREINTRIKSKAFIVTNLIMVLVIIAVFVFIGIFANNGSGNSSIESMLSPTMRKQIDIGSQAKSNVLEKLGVTSDEYDSMVGLETARLTAAEPELSASNSGDFMTSYWIGYGIGYTMFMLIIITGSTLAQGVAEEKASSIAEVILGSTSTFRLLFGKIIGVAILGIIQVCILVLAAIIPAMLFNILTSDIVSVLSAASAPLILIIIAFAFVGYLSYASLLAAFAATIKRAQDVNSAITPVNMIATIGLVGALIGGSGTVGAVMNYCPLLSPFTAPTAFARGDLDTFNTVISLLISCAFLPLVVWFASKLYNNSILNTGGSKMKLITTISNALKRR